MIRQTVQWIVYFVTVAALILRIGDRNRTFPRKPLGLAAIGDASVDCAVVRFGTDGHRIRATFAQLPAAVHYLHYHHFARWIGSCWD